MLYQPETITDCVSINCTECIIISSNSCLLFNLKNDMEIINYDILCSRRLRALKILGRVRALEILGRVDK